MNQPFSEKFSENNLGVHDFVSLINLEEEGLTGSDFKILNLIQDEFTLFEQKYEQNRIEEDELIQRLKEKGIKEENKSNNLEEDNFYSKIDTGITLMEIPFNPIQSENILNETNFTITNIMAQLPLNIIRSNRININLETLNLNIKDSFIPETKSKKYIPQGLRIKLKDERILTNSEKNNVTYNLTNKFKAQVTGLKSEEDAFYFMRKGSLEIKKCIKRYDPYVHIRYNRNELKITNIWATANILKEGFILKLYELIQEGYSEIEDHNSYRLMKKYKDPNMTVMVFKTGSVQIFGGKTKESMEDTFKNKIYPELSRHIYKIANE